MVNSIIIVGGIIIIVLLLYIVWQTYSSRDMSKERVLEEQVTNMQREMSHILQQNAQNLNVQFGNLQQTFDKRLADNTQRLDERLEGATKTFAQVRETIDAQLSQSAKRVDARLENTAQSFAHVKELMARVEASNKQIYEISKDVTSLQDILTAPKLRGGFGELLLADLLASMLPAEFYSLQHRFKGGEAVDAVIQLRDNALISIDSKFPLENFKRIISTEGDVQERDRARKKFISDVKKHVQAIAQKYIVPEEGTLDFALMYIPAENVYYETIISDKGGHELLEYFFKHRVIPVSPNSFYAYLMTIVFGLRGMQVEKRAREMMGALDKLAREHERFAEEFDVVGKHLGNAQKKYDDATRRLSRIENHVDKMKTGEQSAQIEQ